MPKYNFTRKLNLSLYLQGHGYESADFMVEDCDTPEQAQQIIEDWIEKYITEKKVQTAETKTIQNPNVNIPFN